MGLSLPVPPLLLAALCACAALCSPGWALQCYHCHRGNASCGDPFSPELATLVNCSRPQQLCGKITHAADRRASVERRCVSGGGSTSFADGHVYRCGRDLCNAAAAPRAPPAAAAAALLSLAASASAASAAGGRLL